MLDESTDDGFAVDRGPRATIERGFGGQGALAPDVGDGALVGLQ